MMRASATPQNMVLLDGSTETDYLLTEVGGGQVAAYTRRAPDKASENQDAVAVIPFGSEAVVLAVADGAGGLPSGQRASTAAVSALEASILDAISQATLLRTAILNGIETANQSVLDIGVGCATTLTIVTVEGTVARTYQIGDSEALIVGQRGVIKAQTMAHSPTGFAVEAGFLDQKAALHHEERHLVSNFLGSTDMRIDVGAEVRLMPRDTILLASDGLTDNIHLHEITEMMRKGPLEEAVKNIAGLATRRMTVESKHQPSKPDDLSIILFRKPQRKKPRSQTTETTGSETTGSDP